jgi:hypothetical protein
MNKKALAVVKNIAPTHKDWLLLMHIYVTTLSQRDLIDMLKWEAERMHEQKPKITALDHLHHILDELGLKIVAQGK